MPYDPQKHHRRSIRLKGYDYRQAGAYFITLCIRERECILGEVINGRVYLSQLGQIVQKEWYRTAAVRRNVELDVFVIMPNHIHGIIIITDNSRATRQNLSISPDDCEKRVAPTREIMEKPRPKGAASGSLGAIVGQLKSMSAKRINRVRQTPGVPVWQRDFYDHIIYRSESLQAIRQYILDNPLRWTDDSENPNYPVANEDPLIDFPF